MGEGLVGDGLGEEEAGIGGGGKERSDGWECQEGDGKPPGCTGVGLLGEMDGPTGEGVSLGGNREVAVGAEGREGGAGGGGVALAGTDESSLSR